MINNYHNNNDHNNNGFWLIEHRITCRSYKIPKKNKTYRNS